MARVEQRRVVAVSAEFRRAEKRHSLGSGYLLSRGLVLTAAHVVEHPAGVQQVRVRHPGGRPAAATVLWADPAGDVALVGVVDPSWEQAPLPPPRFGVFTGGDDDHSWTAIGYPKAMTRGGERLSEQPRGKISPFTGESLPGRTAHHFAVETGPLYAWGDGEESPWSGMSGAAVFCGDYLLTALILEDWPSVAGHRLRAIGAEAIIALLGFRETVTAHTGEPVYLESVELERIFVRHQPVPASVRPAQLLRVENAVVRFQGRRQELAELRAWCEEGAGFSARLLHSSGGQGKTRLAHQLVQEMRQAGWIAGELARKLTSSDFAAGVALDRPALFVIDYAETLRIDDIEGVIRTLACCAPTECVRLLLLSRKDGDWWEALRRRLLPGSTSERLDPVSAGNEATVECYRQAVADFADRLARYDPRTGWAELGRDLPTPVIAADRYPTTLSLHLKALVDLLQAGPNSVRAMDADTAEDVLFEHEQLYWDRYWQSAGMQTPWHRSVLRAAVAAASLYGAQSRDDAVQTLGLLPALADQDHNTKTYVAEWIHHIYPPSGQSYWGAVQPDPLGEYLVARSAAETPALVEVALPATQPWQREQALTVLSRTAVGRPAVAGLLTRTIVAHPPSLAAAAVSVTTRAEYPAPLIKALDAVLDGLSPATVDLLLIAQIMDVVPIQSLSLARFTARFWELAVEAIQRPDLDEPGVDGLMLCYALTMKALALMNVGRPAAALDAATEADARARAFHELDPQTYAGPMRYAMQAKAVVLRVLGRYEEALTLQREITALTEGEGFEGLDERTAARVHLAMTLSLAGLEEEALANLTEPMELSQGDPTPIAAFDVAVSLAFAHQFAGNLEASLDAFESAARIAEQGRDGHADAFGPLSAAAAFCLTAALLDRGDLVAARGQAEATVRLLRQVSEANPELFVPLLAQCLHMLGDLLWRLDHHDEASVASAEAVAIYRVLGPAHRAEAADALWDAVKIARQRDDYQAVIDLGHEVLDEFRLLNADSGEDHSGAIARLLWWMALALMLTGRLPEAEEYAAEAAAIYSRLGEARPEQYQSQLADALATLLGIKVLRGEAEPSTVTLARQVIDVSRGQPAGVSRDRVLAERLSQFGGLLMMTGNLAEAQEWAGEAVELGRALAAAGVAGSHAFLANALSLLGSLSISDGRGNQALAHHTEAVAAARVAAETDNDSLYTLSNCLVSLAEAEFADGRGAEAVGHVGEALAASKLMDSLLVIQPLLRVIEVRGCAVLVAAKHALGDSGGALEASALALEIYPELPHEQSLALVAIPGIIRSHLTALLEIGGDPDALEHHAVLGMQVWRLVGAAEVAYGPAADDPAAVVELAQIKVMALASSSMFLLEHDPAAATSVLMEANEVLRGSPPPDEDALSVLRAANELWLGQTSREPPDWMAGHGL